MLRLKSIIYILILGFIAVSFVSCNDDLDYFNGSFGEGETNVSLDVSFSGFESQPLTRATVAPPSEGFNTLSDLVVLVYNSEGRLLNMADDGIDGIRNIEFNQSDLTNDNRGDSDASGGMSAETATLSLKNIPLRLPFGQYYLVAVANLGVYQNNNGNIATVTSTYDALNSTFAGQFDTLDDLRRMRIRWIDNDYRNNREMLGYFADPAASAPSYSSNFPLVTINRPGINLRAWLRRCVSKITIDFDGTGLRDDVEIYIKEARVYDYATSCTLGFGVPQSTSDNLADFNNRPGDGDIKIGHTAHVIDYTDGKTDRSQWPTITVSDPYIMETGASGKPQRKNLHAESSPALYFYENMQDNPGGKYSKVPVADLENGGVQDASLKKDGVEFGTYVEVVAQYHCNQIDNVYDGEIKYRFMIGKNVTDNFEAERNHHYKLTLKLRGNANDFDWHIDYDFTPGFDVPNPWYVSYLYNHDAYLPFKYTCPEGYELVDLTAKIISNPWYSTDASMDDLTNPDKTFDRRHPVGEEGNLAYSSDNDYTGNGFLSLRAPRHDGVVTGITAKGYQWAGYTDTNYKNFNQDYFDGKYGGINHGFRTIMKNGRVDEYGDISEPRRYDDGNGNDYTDNIRKREKVEYRKENNMYTFQMPLFTREKILVKQSGYTGNNPFVGYQRIAKVLLTAKVRKINGSETTTHTQKVNCVQVQRVVNPKGVYRKAGNYEPFHVRMMSLSSDAADATFTPIISRGSWTADIQGDANFITLDGKHEISGTTNTPIDFNIRFNRLSTGNKNAVVRIRYHNHTCTHLIFVRQGYAPQAIAHSGKNFEGDNRTPTVWNTFNMIARNKMASDPRDEGSMFKFGHSEDAIDVENNIYKDANGNPMYHDLSYEEFKDRIKAGSALGPFKMLDTEGKVQSSKKGWTAFNSNQNGFTEGAIGEAATVRDYEMLYLSPNIQFGYGVLYADGATETQETLADAYGWYRHDGKNHRGMRGIFAYYWDGELEGGDSYNGRNIFFPIGREGYGHRKNNKEGENNGKGVLRYASQRYAPASEDKGAVYFKIVSPLFEYLFRRSGAIYWFKEKVADKKYLGWNGEVSSDGIAYGVDFNYFTFDVNAITYSNVSGGEDAAFVRTVVK